MLSPYMSPVERAWYYALRILCALVLLFLIVPVLVIVPLSFNSGSFLVYPLQGFSLRWYEALFTSADWMRSLKNSLLIAPAATGWRGHTPCTTGSRPCATAARCT